MKKLIIFIIIIATYSSLAQNNKYILKTNNIIDLTEYKQSDYFFDITKIIDKDTSKLLINSIHLFELNKFLKEYKIKSLRKFVRKLPDDLQTIKTVNGTEFPLAELQRTFIIETESALNETDLQALKESSTLIQNIDKLFPIEVDAWPPNDPRYIYQPQFYNSTYNIDLPRAWNYSAGNSGVKIGIIDHGIDYYHEDLGNGFGQGYRIRGGYDFKDNDGNPKPEYTDETHGTPIAGIVGAVNWNGTGVIGIAGGTSSDINSGCQIFSFRVTSSETSNGKRLLDRELIAEAVFEAATVPEINNGFGYGVHVINCSFGGDSPTYWSWGSLSAQSYYYSFWWAWANNVSVVAAWREDLEDPVWGINLPFQGWTPSSTHFWNADYGDNQLYTQKKDSLVLKADKSKELWASIEFGLHSKELVGTDIGKGIYTKLTLEIPICSSLSIPLFLDRWKSESYNVGFGVGFNFIVFDIKSVTIAASPSLFRELSFHERNKIGLLIPISIAYRVIGNRIRIQSSLAYRTAAELNPGGGDAYSFVIISFGVGIRFL